MAATPHFFSRQLISEIAGDPATTLIPTILDQDSEVRSSAVPSRYLSFAVFLGCVIREGELTGLAVG